MVRVGPDRYETALARAHVRPMDFTHKPMTGYVFVGPGGSRTEKAIKNWIDQGAEFVASLEVKPVRKRPKTGTGRRSRPPLPPTSGREKAGHITS